MCNIQFELSVGLFSIIHLWKWAFVSECHPHLDYYTLLEQTLKQLKKEKGSLKIDYFFPPKSESFLIFITKKIKL